MNLINIYYKEPDPFKLFSSVSTETPRKGKDNCIILWGGEDIATEIYNEPPLTYQSPFKKTHRDEHEIMWAEWAIENDIPIIGICRGAQLMCCLSGGSLIQDMQHPCIHPLTTVDNTTIKTNSAHHQAMIPTPNAEILAEYNGIPEIVWFPETKAFCIQGHPEWPNMHQTCREFINKYLKLFIKNL